MRNNYIFSFMQTFRLKNMLRENLVWSFGEKFKDIQ